MKLSTTYHGIRLCIIDVGSTIHYSTMTSKAVCRESNEMSVTSGSVTQTPRTSARSGCADEVSSNEHRSSDSFTTGTTSPAESDCDCDDNDYGLYDDFEEMPRLSKKAESFVETMTSAELQKHLQTYTKTAKFEDSSRIVVYTIKGGNAPTSCRSFDKVCEKTSTNVSVCISMTEVRVVQDSLGVHPEFHVKMKHGADDYESWKSFDDFMEVANACQEFSSRKRRRPWPAMFSSEVKKNVSYETPRTRLLRKTLLAWERVLVVTTTRHWFSRQSVSSLMTELNALEHFMESLLFEIPDVDILLEFLS
jgi:hypothetical protein